MMTDQDLKDLKWENKCHADCYSPWFHSHHFMIGKKIEKNCRCCQQNMKIDAQIFQLELGKNKACLMNSYKWECGGVDKVILYSGIHKSYTDISMIVENQLSMGSYCASAY